MVSYVLGISAEYHDSAAVLLRDGSVVAAAQEERFSRRKGDSSYPAMSIAYCLAEAGVRAAHVDRVVFYEKPVIKLDRVLQTELEAAPGGFRSFARSFPLWARGRIDTPREIRGRLAESGGFTGDVLFADHHESHAASAFFPSPHSEAAVLTLDAVGEWASTTLGAGRGNRLELTHEARFPHSLGMLYSAFTAYLGFRVNSGEYKMMGLAPYGVPRYRDEILETVVDLADDGSVHLDMDYFGYCRGFTMTVEKFHRQFGGPPRHPDEMLDQRHMDLAASIQDVCELAVLRAARHVHSLTGHRALVMAGGVALNCVANGRLRREGPFEEIWVQPAAGDAGGALGAALLVWHHVLDQPRTPTPGDSQQASLLGPHFGEDDIEAFLASVSADYEKIVNEADLVDRVARLIDDGKIVGWFHGRMEFGPRSLGARSILGDARATEMQQKMNLKIKFRESFRPFAPAVLKEHAHEIFEMDETDDWPYMLFVAPIRAELRRDLTDEERQQLADPDLRIRVAVPRSSIPAVTHVDYSARVQTVDRRRHGRFHRLLHRFHELTGCPVMINTSFNVRGEPIVCTPEDAYWCFLATEIDCLVVEDFVMFKERQPPEALAGAYLRRRQFEPD
jgi:carbamoyltransferase